MPLISHSRLTEKCHHRAGPLHIRLDQLRRDQLRLMAERPQNPRPMVGCAAGLDPDHRRCKRLEEGHHLFAPQLLTQNHLLGGVHPMKLEKMQARGEHMFSALPTKAAGSEPGQHLRSAPNSDINSASPTCTKRQSASHPMSAGRVLLKSIDIRYVGSAPRSTQPVKPNEARTTYWTADEDCICLHKPSAGPALAQARCLPARGQHKARQDRER